MTSQLATQDESRKPENNLTANEIQLLGLIATGHNNRQICIHLTKLRGPVITIGMLQNERDALYAKLGVMRMGYGSRAYALSVAITRYNLQAPTELKNAISLLSSKEVRVVGVKQTILELIAEGKSTHYIGYILQLTHDDVMQIIAQLQVQLGLDTLPPFSVAAAALWSNTISNVSLTSQFIPSRDQVQLMAWVAQGLGAFDIGQLLGIQEDAAKGRLRAIEARMRVSSHVQMIACAIAEHWLQLTNTPRLTPIVEQVMQTGFTSIELEIIRLIIQGKTTAQIQKQLLGRFTTRNAFTIIHFLHERLGTSTQSMLVAVTLLAGEPLAPDTDPADLEVSRPTPDEVQILRGLFGGITGQAIADNLHMPKGTCDTVISDLYRYLGVNTAHHAVALAARDGYISLEVLESYAPAVLKAAAGISDLYLQCLNLMANGIPFKDCHTHVGATSYSTLSRHVEPDRNRLRPFKFNTLIGVLVHVGKIKVTSPSRSRTPWPDSTTGEQAAAEEPTHETGNPVNSLEALVSADPDPAPDQEFAFAPEPEPITGLAIPIETTAIDQRLFLAAEPEASPEAPFHQEDQAAELTAVAAKTYVTAEMQTEALPEAIEATPEPSAVFATLRLEPSPDIQQPPASTVPEVEPELIAEMPSRVDLEPETEPEAVTAPAAETSAQAEPEPDVETEPEAEALLYPEPETESQPNYEPEVIAQDDPEPGVETQPPPEPTAEVEAASPEPVAPAELAASAGDETRAAITPEKFMKSVRPFINQNGDDQKAKRNGLRLSGDLERFLTKNFPTAIECLKSGELKLPTTNLNKPIGPRWVTVLEMTLLGYSVDDIREMLGEDDRTFKQRNDALCRAFGTRTLKGAALIAKAAGLIQ